MESESSSNTSTADRAGKTGDGNTAPTSPTATKTDDKAGPLKAEATNDQNAPLQQTPTDNERAANATNTNTGELVQETATTSSSSPSPLATSNGNASSRQTQTPAVQSSAPAASNNGLSDGALAGAMVGSIIGTALVTLLLAFLFFRRQQKQSSKELGKRSRSSSALDTFVPSIQEKQPAATTGFSIESIIPEPADDETVRKRILTVLDQACLHVDDFYLTSPPAKISENEIARLAEYNSQHLPSPVQTMLVEGKNQRQVITHCLVRTLLQEIQPDSGADLLPTAFAAQFALKSPGNDEALFNWRMLTAYLNGRKCITSNAGSDYVQQSIEKLAADFASTFEPFTSLGTSVDERLSHFGGVALSAADLGVWLFGQPCSFEFVWDGPDESGGFVGLPKVLKTGDERGRKLVEPLVLIKETKSV